MNANISHLDGNVAGGELSGIFNVDLTAAVGQCANCGANEALCRSPCVRGLSWAGCALCCV